MQKSHFWMVYNGKSHFWMVYNGKSKAPHDVWWVLTPMSKAFSKRYPGPLILSSSCIRICVSIPGLSPHEREPGKNLLESQRLCVCLLWTNCGKSNVKNQITILRQFKAFPENCFFWHQCSCKQILIHQLSSRDPSCPQRWAADLSTSAPWYPLPPPVEVQRRDHTKVPHQPAARWSRSVLCS